jgi:hypothetical protein
MSPQTQNLIERGGIYPGMRLIYEESRRFAAVEVLDAGLFPNPDDNVPAPGLKTVALPSSDIWVEFSPEGGPGSIMVQGVHVRMEGEGSGPQLRLTLRVIDLPGFTGEFPRTFTISGRADVLSFVGGGISAYMEVWSLTTDPDRVQAIIELAARRLPWDRFLRACRELQRGAMGRRAAY